MSLIVIVWYQNYRKEGVLMKSKRTIQKKFRIDRSTEKALQKILSNNKITFQSIMESLLREYIYKNINVITDTDK